MNIILYKLYAYDFKNYVSLTKKTAILFKIKIFKKSAQDLVLIYIYDYSTFKLVHSCFDT